MGSNGQEQILDELTLVTGCDRGWSNGCASNHKKPARGGLSVIWRREGLSETIPGFGPPGACGDQIRSRRICRTRQPSGLRGFSSPIASDSQKICPTAGAYLLRGGERGIVRNHPWFRPGGRLRRPNSLPANLSNPAALWAARVLNHVASVRQKICPTAGAYLLRGGERGIRTLDGLFEPILP